MRVAPSVGGAPRGRGWRGSTPAAGPPADAGAGRPAPTRSLPRWRPDGDQPEERDPERERAFEGFARRHPASHHAAVPAGREEQPRGDHIQRPSRDPPAAAEVAAAHPKAQPPPDPAQHRRMHGDVDEDDQRDEREHRSAQLHVEGSTEDGAEAAPWSPTLPQEQLRAAGDQEVGQRADQLVAEPAVQAKGAGVEVGDAEKHVRALPEDSFLRPSENGGTQSAPLRAGDEAHGLDVAAKRALEIQQQKAGPGAGVLDPVCLPSRVGHQAQGGLEVAPAA